MILHGKRFFNLTVFIRILAIIALAVSLFGSSGLSFVLAVCTVTGTVYRDYNANGVQDAQEPGVEDITVRAHSATGPVGTATTAANGAYSLPVTSVPDNTEIRIEFSGLPPYLRTGPFGGESATTVTFVDCTGAVGGVDLGTANPGQYCHTANPMLATPCFVPGDATDTFLGDQDALIIFEYTAGAPGNASFDDPPFGTAATAAEIGSTFGLAHQRSTNVYFASAYLKRHVSYGPEGPGGIYSIDLTTTPPTVDVLATINNTEPAGGIDRPGATPVEYISDENTYEWVGRASLGEIDISEDDTTLYTINLFRRELVRITIANGAIRTFPIPEPTPGCTNGEWRPFGLGILDFQVYVGGVCDASGAGATAADLDAHVLVFNPNTGVVNRNPVLSIDLDYPRRCADTAPTCPNADADWQPWSDIWPTMPGVARVNPQPILADIEFDNGNMILGLRDRFGDQSGNLARSPNVGDTTLYVGIPAGDILRACGGPQIGWTIEDSANCGGVQTAGNIAPFDLQGPGDGEYYFADFYPEANNELHDEITMGGIYQLPGSPDMAVVAFDPVPVDASVNLFDAGVIWLDNTLGTRRRSYRIFEGDLPVPGEQAAVFGKANGLGSLEATCGPAPLEIGNRVWEDLDLNGRQDPNEMVFAGVTLQLWMDTDGDGTVDMQVGETQTSATGEYYFNEATVFDNDPALPEYPFTFFDIDEDGARDLNEPAGIMPNATYEVRVLGGGNYGAGGILEQYFATTLNQGGVPSDMRDSDGLNPSPQVRVDTTNFPRAVVRTGDFGENDHTWDFGFALLPPPRQQPPPPSSGGGTPVSAIITKSVNPPFAQPGDTVTWTITVTNPNSFPLTNVVVTDTMPSEVEITSVSASSGNVSSSGQTVTFNQGTMAPGETVTINVVTRVRPNVSVPFTISNGATLTATDLSPLFASADLISAGELPGTGESPWSRWRIPIFALAGGVIVLAGYWLVRRARR